MLRIVIFFVLLVAINVQLVNGLKCHMCGQYNEGGGSITPCLNYSDVQASNFLKECTKPTDKYCVKYVSELAPVRDCATDCTEKEVWQSRTFCCTEDGCNSSNIIHLSILNAFLVLFKFF
ncbi:hypothetical protein ACFFRR_009585 [Megaselia abdita]